MATYTVRYQTTTAITGTTGAALSREAAISAVVATAIAAGPTGREVNVWQSIQTAASGPTGTYATTFNTTAPMTGGTFSATTREEAIGLAVAAGPTGPGSNTLVSSAS